jgi:hypothetical protein
MRPKGPRRPRGHAAAQPGSGSRLPSPRPLLSDDLVLTRRGSRLYDLTWDFRDDHLSLGLFSWEADIVSSGVVIGRLGDPRFDRLRRPLLEAVAARWKYRRREDGKAWAAKRACAAAAAARAFARWVAARGVTSVEQVDETVFQAWLDQTKVTGDGQTPRQHRDRKVLADAVLLLWRVRDRISATVGFVPFSHEVTDWVADGPQPTPIPLVPKAVLDHVVGAALRYIEVYSHDIFQARLYVDNLKQEWERTFGRPAPAWKRGDLEHGAYDTWLGRRFGTKNRHAAERMGCPAPWNPDGLFVRDPDTGEPWLSSIRTRRHLQQLENSLRTACFIVIAFLTGGRILEVTTYKCDCVPTFDLPDPGPAGHRIRGWVTKHRGSEPEIVDWTVPDVAVKAAGLLLRLLASWRRKTGADWLMVTQTGSRLDERLLTTDLKVFLDRVEAPYVDGKLFPLSAHMLRVALAQWLAQEPYGEIAGAIHLKQLSTAAFRGYLREDPRWQSMYESFVVQAQADHLELVMNEPVLLGRGGGEIMRARTPERQAEIDAAVRSINYAQVGREAPSARTMDRLKKSQRPVYKTKYTMCFFKPDAAECLKGRPASERRRPITHRCEPLTCTNSAITRLQVPAYLEDLEECAALAADPGQSPSQVEIYREQVSDLGRLVAPYVPVLVRERALLEQQLRDAPPREVSTLARVARRDEVDDLLRRIESTGLALEASHDAR